MKTTMSLMMMVMVCCVDRIDTIEKLSAALCRVMKIMQEYIRNEASTSDPKKQDEQEGCQLKCYSGMGPTCPSH